MSALDRDKAREVLRRYADWDDTTIEDATLDHLEECVQPGWAGLWAILDETYPEDIIPTQYVDADHGNGPQVVSLLRLLGRAEAKLAAIATLHQPEQGGMGYHDDGSYGSFDGPVCTTCGTADEYGVPWPCPTARALGVTS